MKKVSQQSAIKQLRRLEKLGSSMRLAAEGWDKPWKILIATLLSARTRDEVTIVVATKLFQQYPTPEKLAHASLEDVEAILKPINFYKNKSKHIIQCAHTLVTHYKGEVPLSFETLITLSGVGRKTAHVFLSEHGHNTIGVDTHVSYISCTLGWTTYKDQKHIEDDLKKLFPQMYWGKLNPILVRFGKTYTSKKKKDALLETVTKLS